MRTMVAFQTFSPRVLPSLSTTAQCRDSSMQLHLALRKTLLVFLRLASRAALKCCNMFSCSCTILSKSCVQDSSSPSCCQEPLLITARSRIRSHARPEGFVQSEETSEKQQVGPRVQRQARLNEVLRTASSRPHTSRAATRLRCDVGSDSEPRTCRAPRP